MLRVLFVAALAFRLLLDIGTPLMPGAFRFDPAESIDAHRTQSARSATQSIVRPIALPQVAVEHVGDTDAGVPRREMPDVRSPRFQPLLARRALDWGPEAAEDH